jgi:hypothetical protein
MNAIPPSNTKGLRPNNFKGPAATTHKAIPAQMQVFDAPMRSKIEIHQGDRAQFSLLKGGENTIKILVSILTTYTEKY